MADDRNQGAGQQALALEVLAARAAAEQREREFCVKHEAPNIGLWSDNLTSATAGCVKLRQLEQLGHIVKGGQPERQVLDRMCKKVSEAFMTLKLLTSLQPMVRRLFWVRRARDFRGG